MVPTWAQKPGKTGEHFPVREIYPKYWKNQKKIELEIGKKVLK